MQTSYGEFKIVTLRETAPEYTCDAPQKGFEYVKENVFAASWFDSEKENFVVLLLDSRRKIIGHNLVAIGWLNSVPVHPREVFRPAIIGSANSIVMVHNHPSGDTTPSDSDVKITRDLIRAGQLLKIEIDDHIVVAKNGFSSLRTLGYFYH